MGRYRVPALPAALVLSLSATAPAAPRRGLDSPSADRISGTVVFALLAVSTRNLRAVAERTLAPAPSRARTQLIGHYLALRKDRKVLYALLPSAPEKHDLLSMVDIATAKVRKSFQLSRGVAHNGLAVGSVTRRLYLFGNRVVGRETTSGTRPSDAVIDVVDPANGRTLRAWTARQADGHEWHVYQGLVSQDEQRLFISYHGRDTTGIDWFTTSGDQLQSRLT